MFQTQGNICEINECEARNQRDLDNVRRATWLQRFPFCALESATKNRDFSMENYCRLQEIARVNQRSLRLPLLGLGFIRSSNFSDFRRVHGHFEVICAFLWRNVNFKLRFITDRGKLMEFITSAVSWG